MPRDPLPEVLPFSHGKSRALPEISALRTQVLGPRGASSGAASNFYSQNAPVYLHRSLPGDVMSEAASRPMGGRRVLGPGHIR